MAEEESGVLRLEDDEVVETRVCYGRFWHGWRLVGNGVGGKGERVGVGRLEPGVVVWQGGGVKLNEIPKERPPGVDLFDMDGTLVAWDCQLLFRHFVVRRSWWRGLLLPVFLVSLPFAKVLGTERMKRVFLCYLWRVDEGRLAEWSREFAAEVVPAVYPELRAMLEEARARGHFTVLASASPECYAGEVGRMLGFDLSLGTEVEFGPFFPRLVNHKGEEKVRRLRRLLPEGWWEGGKLANSTGYTDSRADLPMLGICGKAVTVNPGAELTALAEENGWKVVRPERPWKGRVGFGWRVVLLLLGLGRDPGGLGR